jgi:hypothetical protein
MAIAYLARQKYVSLLRPETRTLNMGASHAFSKTLIFNTLEQLLKYCQCCLHLICGVCVTPCFILVFFVA